MHNNDISLQSPVPGAIFLRAGGIMTLIVSVIQFILGMYVYQSYSSPKFGAWWAAVVAMVSSFLAIASCHRTIAIATMIVSIFAVVIGVIGCLVDSIAGGYVSSLVVCGTEPPLHGDPYDNYQLSKCFTGYSGSHECSCIQKDSSFCHHFVSLYASCSDVRGEYLDAIHAAVTFDLISTLLMLALSVLTCVIVCCPSTVSRVMPRGVEGLEVTTLHHSPLVHMHMQTQMNAHGQHVQAYDQYIPSHGVQQYSSLPSTSQHGAIPTVTATVSAPIVVGILASPQNTQSYSF